MNTDEVKRRDEIFKELRGRICMEVCSMTNEQVVKAFQFIQEIAKEDRGGKSE